MCVCVCVWGGGGGGIEEGELWITSGTTQYITVLFVVSQYLPICRPVCRSVEHLTMTYTASKPKHMDCMCMFFRGCVWLWVSFYFKCPFEISGVHMGLLMLTLMGLVPRIHEPNRTAVKLTAK